MIFKDHPQIQIMLDILARHEQHHVMVLHSHSEKEKRAFIQSLELSLPANKFSLYFDLENFAELSHSVPNARFIIFCDVVESNVMPAKAGIHFSRIYLAELTLFESIALLKFHAKELESFHQVMFDEESFSSACKLAAKFFPGKFLFDKAFALLDSAAARASSSGISIVTPDLLMQVVSLHTQIQHIKFQTAKFNDALQKIIFGQHDTLNLIGSLLQNAQVSLAEKTGPLCNFLFVGPPDSGKTTTAKAIAEHLFGHNQALLTLQQNKTTPAALANLKVTSSNHENYSMSLKDALDQIPYGVFLFEDVDQFPAELLSALQIILTEGYLIDEQNKKYDFRHAIIIMTTRISCEQIIASTTHQDSSAANKPVDLMQLVLNVYPEREIATDTKHALSLQELCAEILPTLETHFSPGFLQLLNIVPFFPLDYAALEKFIRAKMKTLVRQLDVKFGIELNFSSDVVNFLAHEASWRKAHTKSLDKLLEHHLYSGIAHEIANQVENKNRLKRLMVRLSDTGQLLRFEFAAANETWLSS